MSKEIVGSKGQDGSILGVYADAQPEGGFRSLAEMPGLLRALLPAFGDVGRHAQP
jgi:hypothetical protein